MADIQANTLVKNWAHVESAKNPADLISRGVTVDELEKSTLWWTGPEFLRTTEWPKWQKGAKTQFVQEEFNKEVLKAKCSPVVLLASRGQNGQALKDIMETHSSMRAALRVTAYVFRFIKACKAAVSRTKRATGGESAQVNLARKKRTTRRDDRHIRVKKKPGREKVKKRLTRMAEEPEGRARIIKMIDEMDPISEDEYAEALIHWIRVTQKEEYPREYAALLGGKGEMPKDSKLAKLTIQMDQEKLIRLQGRLANADIGQDQKYPYILPASATLSKRLMEEAHHNTMHGNLQLSQQYIRDRYWIVGLRSAMKNVIHHCVKCARYRQQTSKQLMADLPPDRVQLSRPFAYCGVDYAGPVRIKARSGRGAYVEELGYMALFVCLAIKAVHIEVVADATTQTFLAALDRFIARRGNVKGMRSDNASYFVCAVKELEMAIQQWNHKELHAEIIKRGITWRFNTPLAPHQGGIWEANIKAFKYHFKRALGDTILTYEQLATLATRIEAVMNSRPMTALADDPSEMTALTPAHFLHGEQLIRPLGPRVIGIPANRLTSWQRITQMEQQFARRWQKEYLYTLQRRNKWYRKERDMEVGDLVFVRDDYLPPGQWMIGRVLELFPGKDGLIRNVRIKTRKGEYDRSITRCCVLPLERNYDEDLAKVDVEAELAAEVGSGDDSDAPA